MKPIRSKRDLAEARRALHDLREQLSALRKTYRHDKESYRTATRGLRQLTRETTRAIVTYELAQKGTLPAIVGTRNPETGELEVPRVLRLLRQAAQLGQAEIAERLGTKQGNISRWEREGYDRYTLPQLVKIADVLGHDVDVVFVRREGKGQRNE